MPRWVGGEWIETGQRHAVKDAVKRKKMDGWILPLLHKNYSGRTVSLCQSVMIKPH